MGKPAFAITWQRILHHEGQTFKTKGRPRPLPFTYRVQGKAIVPSRADYTIPRTAFEEAYRIVPYAGPGVLNDVVRGPSYVWAILHDPRIRANDW